jgi:hypothetical protein
MSRIHNTDINYQAPLCLFCYCSQRLAKLRAMGLKDVPELIEKFVGVKYGGTSDRTLDTPLCITGTYFCFVGLLLYSIMRRCALLTASQDNILQLHESYVVVAKGARTFIPCTLPHSIFPSHAILLSCIWSFKITI